MPFCKYCGTQNDSQAKFCKGCGKELTVAEPSKQTEETVEDTGKLENLETNNSPEMNETSNAPEFPNMDDVPLAAAMLGNSNTAFATGTMEKNKSKKIFLLSFIAVFLAAVLGYGGFAFAKNASIKNNPMKRTLLGITNNAKAKNMHTTATLKLKMANAPTDLESQMISKIIEDITIKLDSKTNQTSNQSNINISLIYRNQNLVDGTAYIDKDMLVITAPAISKDPLYIKIAELNKLKNENANPIDYTKYMSLFNMKNDKNWKAISKNYSKFTDENVGKLFSKGEKASITVDQNGKSVSIKCDEVVLSFTDKDLASILEKLIKKAVDDENIKALVKAKSEEFFKLAEKNGDLEKFNLTKEDIEDFRKNYDEQYKEIRDEAKDNIDLSALSDTLSFKTDMKLAFDSKNYIRNIHLETSLTPKSLGDNMGFKMIFDQVFNTVNGKVDIAKPSIKNGKDMSKLTDADMEELEANFEQLMSDIMQKAGLGF